VLMQTLQQSLQLEISSPMADETISRSKTLLKVKIRPRVWHYNPGIFQAVAPPEVRGRRASATNLNEAPQRSLFWFGFAGKCANVLRLWTFHKQGTMSPSRIVFAADYGNAEPFAATQASRRRSSNVFDRPRRLRSATSVRSLLTKCEVHRPAVVRIDRLKSHSSVP